MTPAQLRAELAALLAPHLGEFQNGQPAIWVGEPPSDWTASGLECHIPPFPDVEQIAAYARGATVEHYVVRLVARGPPTTIRAAIRAILARWPDAQPNPPLEPNERMGLLAQQTIRIPV